MIYAQNDHFMEFSQNGQYKYSFLLCCFRLAARLMGRTAEATGLGFVCFVIFNPRVLLLANRVDFGLLFVVVLKMF